MGIIQKKSAEEESYLASKASLSIDIQYFNMNV